MADETATLILLGEIKGEVGEVKGEVAAIRARLDRMDQRLDDGDARFEQIATTSAKKEGASGVERAVAQKVGALVLTMLGTIGAGAIATLYAHAPAIAAWFIPPKH